MSADSAKGYIEIAFDSILPDNVTVKSITTYSNWTWIGVCPSSWIASAKTLQCAYAGYATGSGGHHNVIFTAYLGYTNNP